MRLFFAIPINESITLKIANWRDRVLLPQSRWVPLENYHITLAFLGEFNARSLESLIESCTKIANGNDHFQAETLNLDQTGYWSKPGILWIGPSRWPDSLMLLNKRLVQLGVEFGARKETKSYQPHITLARKCDVPSKPLMEPCFEMSYDAFSLYESVNTRSGVRYQELESWSLS